MRTGKGGGAGEGECGSDVVEKPLTLDDEAANIEEIVNAPNLLELLLESVMDNANYVIPNAIVLAIANNAMSLAISSYPTVLI